MSIKLMTAVWDNESGNLNFTETAILVKLADFGLDDGTSIWPSYGTMAKRLKCDASTVRKTINKLIEKGYVFKQSRFPDGKQTSNQYFINAARLWKEASKEAPPEPLTDVFKDEEGSVSHEPPLGPQPTPPRPTAYPPQAHSLPNHPLSTPLNSSSRAEKIEEQERAAAMARLAELHKGEQAKLRSRPRPAPEPEGEFRYEPTQLHPIAEDDKPLSDELYEEGVSKGCILALLRAHPNRAHIRQSLKKLKHAIKTKGVKSPDGFMRHVMNDPYEEERVSKTALKEADRAKQSALDEQKRKQEWEARERLKQAPQAKQANAGCMSDLAKLLPTLSSRLKSKQAGMTSH